jgi:hypothetical protein
MTKNILEWGWHTSTPTSSSSTSDWKPATTLLGRTEDSVDIAAAGDLRCVGGSCASGGDYGATAAYRVNNTPLCRKCAVRRLGIEDEPSNEQYETLRNFEMPGR